MEGLRPLHFQFFQKFSGAEIMEEMVQIVITKDASGMYRVKRMSAEHTLFETIEDDNSIRYVIGSLVTLLSSVPHV